MIQQAHDILFAALPDTFTQKYKELIEEAFLLAKEAHKMQSRDSGIPYIPYPVLRPTSLRDKCSKLR